MTSGEHNNPSGEGVGFPTAGETAGVSGELKEKAGFFAPWKAGTTGMRARAGGL